MIWKDYSKLDMTAHAFCSGSNSWWRRDDVDEEKLVQRKIASYSTTIGTLLHTYAAKSIKDKFKMLETDKHSVLRYLMVENKIPGSVIDIDRLFPNLKNYINDCIGFRMDPEVKLYYSPDFNGTADAIYWHKGTLRISDLKTGVKPADFMQLENYAAFFCLDYNIDPKLIKKMEFRIYQDCDIIFAEPDSSILKPIIERIVAYDNFLRGFEGRR